MQFHFVRLIDLINNFIRDHLSIHTHVYFANEPMFSPQCFSAQYRVKS